MVEIFAELLANPAIRAVVEEIVIKVIADIFHRRSTDAVFLQQSDAAFAQLSQAKTDEDRANAQKAIQALLNS